MSGFPDLLSLESPPGTQRPLRVCIATEDFAGPTRNGGIGAVYAALARLLAADGHEVTVLHLRPEGPEQGAADSWRGHFRTLGIRYETPPGYARQDGFRRPKTPWLTSGYELMGWLTENPVDLVHASEWGALPYLALLAKRCGLAFERTTFIVKASSPIRWSAEAVGRTLDPVEQARAHAEQRTVELADMVVGGSAHLLSWMRSSGYRLPERTYVQPNVLFERPTVAAKKDALTELVFFGRLEARKGLDLFIDAVDRLIADGSMRPARITFAGKPGRVAAGEPTIRERLSLRSAGWPFPVAVQTEWSSDTALAYLAEGGRLAVCPSLIENASVALHELMLAGLPLVATDVGGNAELIHPEDRPHALCAATAEGLASALARALTHGATHSRLAFDNAINLEVWRQFHLSLSAQREPVSTHLKCATGDAAVASEWVAAMEPAMLEPTARPRPRGAGRAPAARAARSPHGAVVDRLGRSKAAYVGELPPQPPRRPRRALRPHALAAAGVDGWCEPSSDGVLRGWAWRFDEPERVVDVAVYIDGVLHTCVPAQTYRADLADAGVGDGGYGFSLPLPEASRRRRIDVLATCARLPLRRSPLVADGPRLTAL